MTKTTRQQRNEVFRREEAIREWEHAQCFKAPDPDCDWCGGWGETQGSNPANCDCVQRTPTERATWVTNNPRPE